MKTHATPRTDEFLNGQLPCSSLEQYLINFARQLERENLVTQDDLRSAQRRAQKYLNALNALASNGVLSESTIEHYVHEEDRKLRQAACLDAPTSA